MSSTFSVISLPSASIGFPCLSTFCFSASALLSCLSASVGLTPSFLAFSTAFLKSSNDIFLSAASMCAFHASICSLGKPALSILSAISNAPSNVFTVGIITISSLPLVAYSIGCLYTTLSIPLDATASRNFFRLTALKNIPSIATGIDSTFNFLLAAMAKSSTSFDGNDSTSLSGM